LANSETKDLYEIGGAYYYDPSGANRATAADQSAYLIGQAQASPTNTTMADMGWANPQGGWIGTNTTRSDYADTPVNYNVQYDDYPNEVLGLKVNYAGIGNDATPYVKIAGENGKTVSYYNPNTWAQKDAIMQALGIGDYSQQAKTQRALDSAPMVQDMTYDDMYAQAEDRVNPIFNALRDRENAAAAANREQIAQVMAARYGMGGTRGGRIASQMTKSQQAEGMAINQIEGDRQRGIADLADQLWQRELQRQQNAQQLALQQEQNDIAWATLKQNTATENQRLALEREFRYLDDQQWMLKYGLSKEEFAYRKMADDRAFNEDVRQFDATLGWEKQQYADDMAYKQAALAARSSGGSGGTGGYGGTGGSGGSGGNELSYKDRLIRATELAKADPRLADVYDEAKGTFTLAQLVDAYLNII
jgi:hypothetical protein